MNWIQLVCCGFLISWSTGPVDHLVAQNQPTAARHSDWLTQKDDRTLIKIRLELTLPDGTPATDVDVDLLEFRPHAPSRHELDGNRLTAWLVPTAYGSLPTIEIKSRDGRYFKSVSIARGKVRHVGMLGKPVELSPVRWLKILILDAQGEPVENAKVFLGGKQLSSDARGIVPLPVSADESLRFAVRAIGPEGEVGALRSSDLTETELSQEDVELKLGQGVLQTIKLVDENDVAVPHHLIVPQPKDRGIECVPENGYPIYSNKDGEVKVTWLPKPPLSRAFIQIPGTRFLNAGEERTEEDWTVHLAPLHRNRIRGIVTVPPGTSAHGIQVRLMSFDHPTEGRVDQLVVFSNAEGEFFADVLPGAVYGAFIEDQDLVSDVWGGVIVDADGKITPPVVSATPGIPIRVVCTQGPDQTPKAGQEVVLKWRSRIVSASGVIGMHGPSIRVVTDRQGVAIANVPETKVTATIYEPGSRDSLELEIKRGSGQEFRFHR